MVYESCCTLEFVIGGPPRDVEIMEHQTVLHQRRHDADGFAIVHHQFLLELQKFVLVCVSSPATDIDNSTK